MIALSVNADVSQIIKALEETVITTSRTIPEVINGTLWAVARGAVAETSAADKEKIRSDRMRPSRIKASAPTQAIIINYNRGKKGLKGLNGAKMSIAVEKQINKTVAYSQYTRSQWLTPAKILSPKVKGKSGAPKLPSGVSIRKGTHNGGAIPATSNSGLQSKGAIWISVEAKSNTSHVQSIVDKGLQKAIDKETQDKMKHNLEKQIQEGIVKIWG